MIGVNRQWVVVSSDWTFLLSILGDSHQCLCSQTLHYYIQILYLYCLFIRAREFCVFHKYFEIPKLLNARRVCVAMIFDISLNAIGTHLQNWQVDLLLKMNSFTACVARFSTSVPGSSITSPTHFHMQARARVKWRDIYSIVLWACFHSSSCVIVKNRWKKEK